MKKDSFYFPHFSNARNDSKLIRLRRIFGIEGYGIYFMLLEILREQSDFKYPVAGVEDLAFEWHIGKEKILSIINDFGLFNVENNEFFSLKLILYLQPYFEKSQRARIAANKRWDNANAYANALPEHMQTQCGGNASKVKESKVKESKLKKTKLNENKDIIAKHAFCKSPYFDFNIFKSKIDEKYKQYDLEFYHEIAKNYSESKGAKYIDWLAAIRGWILRDIADKKARAFIPTGTPESIKAEKMRKLDEALKKLNAQNS